MAASWPTLWTGLTCARLFISELWGHILVLILILTKFFMVIVSEHQDRRTDNSVASRPLAASLLLQRGDSRVLLLPSGRLLNSLTKFAMTAIDHFQFPSLIQLHNDFIRKLMLLVLKLASIVQRDKLWNLWL